MEKVYIKDKQGNKVLPKTHVSAVYDDEGNDLDSHLGAFEDEVRGLVDTPHQEYVTVATYASLPASGSKDTIYRVSNYNGSTSQVDTTSYSEYAWDGSQYIFLCVKSQIDQVFDITVYNSNTKYADLSAALGTNGANIPQSLRKGGMSVKYVQSSDNNYIQARLMSDTFSTNINDWQVVDTMPIAGSKNLIESGGAFNSINALNEFLLTESLDLYNKNDLYENGASYYIQWDGTIAPTIYTGITTNPIRIGNYKQVRIAAANNLTPAYGYRFLGNDGTTIISYGQSVSSTEMILGVPNGAAYFQFSFDARQTGNSSVSIFLRVSKDRIKALEDENASQNTSLQSHAESIESIEKILGSEESADLYDASDLYKNGASYYIQVYNGEIASTVYTGITTNPIPLNDSTLVVIKSQNALNAAYGYRFLAADGTTIVTYGAPQASKENQIEVPEGAAYFQFSFDARTSEGGNTSVEIYTISCDVINRISDLENAVSKLEINPRTALIVHNQGIVASEGELSAWSPISCFDWQIDLSLEFPNGFQPFKIKKGFFAVQSYIEVNSTNVVSVYGTGSGVLTESVVHNMQFGNSLSLNMTFEKGYMTIKIYNASYGIFTHKFIHFAGDCGVQFFNLGSADVKVVSMRLSNANNYKKEILMLGDSYMFTKWGDNHGADYNYAYTTNLEENGFVFSNVSLAGANSEYLYNEFIDLINGGYKPRYVIWGMGMNDQGTDGYSNWLSYITQAKAKADAIGALFIPCTIPSTPSYDNDAKNSYIKANFSRYIDFDDALTGGRTYISGQSVWKDGYLSSDNLHPTARGFFAMMEKLLDDFPEIYFYKSL